MSWYPRLSTGRLSYFRHIPKVDLHRHLEGSLRLETLRELADEHQIELPGADFATLVQMQRDDMLTFSTFLSKFQILRQFYRTPEIIMRLTHEAVADAAADGVQYLELRFTPVALTRLQNFSLAEVMDWVVDATRQAAEVCHITTRLIVSLNRHESLELGETVTRLAAERLAPSINGGIVGLDLAGNEAEFSALPFAGLLHEASQAGLRLSIHAGEWGPPGNIRQAILQLGAERIGHGVRVLEDPDVVALARERGTTFEVCVTSNYQSGVVPALTAHPLEQMIDSGLNVTINTDDPGVSDITLSDEYRLALEDLGIPQSALIKCITNGAQAAFLPPEERKQLESKLEARLISVLRD